MLGQLVISSGAVVGFVVATLAGSLAGVGGGGRVLRNGSDFARGGSATTGSFEANVRNRRRGKHTWDPASQTTLRLIYLLQLALEKWLGAVFLAIRMNRDRCGRRWQLYKKKDILTLSLRIDQSIINRVDFSPTALEAFF